MMADKAHQLFALFCLFHLWTNCNGKITSLNEKYSAAFQTTLKSVDLKFDENVLEPPPHNIVKRAGRHGITPHMIQVDKSVLEGTEKSNQAFVHWVGKDVSEKVIVLTCQLNVSSGMGVVVQSQLWRSDDYGSSFNKVDVGKGAKISYFYTFSNNSQRLLFTDVSTKKVYTSQDGQMDDIQEYTVPVEPDMVLPCPYDQDKILIYSLTKQKLYVTHDFAKTWTLLAANVLPKFYWGSPDYDEPGTVHMEIESSTPDSAEYRSCVSDQCTPQPNGMEYLGPFLAGSLTVYKEFMFVQKANVNGTENYLMVSYKRQPFQVAYFPGDIKAKDFMLLSLDDNQLFVAVSHSNKVNLYLSDPTGHYFVLSFEDVYHVVHAYWLEIDLHEVQGMNWTFIVNKKNSSESSGARSYISFDKGGNWGPIPLTDTMKKDCKSDHCHLLLNVKQSLISNPVISSSHAPGMIAAHGTLVSAGSPNPPVSVFTSRDGGWTWNKAPFDGLYHLTILDQGSIITALPDGLFSSNRSKSLFFSCDEGVTWTEELYDNLGFKVNGVLTEPGILTLTEMLFGHEMSQKPWILMKLDFKSVLLAKCAESDYETWYPTDFNDASHNNCTMGRLIEYKRRKQGAKCHNGNELIPRVASKDRCNCTREDYECDYGFEEKGSKCSKSKWFYEGYLPVDCHHGDQYNKTQGYRKVSSDVCVEDEAQREEYDSVVAPCPSVKPHGLALSTHSLHVAMGKDVSFYLSQAGGSTQDTKYVWDLGDGSKLQTFEGFEKARHLTYTYATSGKFKVKVTATNVNVKGDTSTSLDLHVQDRLSALTMITPLMGVVGFPMLMNVTVSSQLAILQEQSKHVHFIWTFGDELASARPLLGWESSVSHTYMETGSYAVTVEAINSIGSVFRQFEVVIYEHVAFVILKFQGSGVVNLNNPIINQLILQRLRYQLADDLGVGLDRLQTSMSVKVPSAALLAIYPSQHPADESFQTIKDRVLDLVNNGHFGFSLLGKRAEGGVIIKVTSAQSYTPDKPDHGGKGEGHSFNLRAILIGVPVLLLVVVVIVLLLCYYRRRRRSGQQYSMLDIQDDSDNLLDDEDDPPLDLNIEFRGRDSFRDDPVLDAGGGSRRSHLVMQDNMENC